MTSTINSAIELAKKDWLEGFSYQPEYKKTRIRGLAGQGVFRTTPDRKVVCTIPNSGHWCANRTDQRYYGNRHRRQKWRRRF